MKKYFYRSIFFLGLLALSILSVAQCPQWGSATKPKEKQLNIAKNRSVTVGNSQTPQFISLNDLISDTKQEDSTWYTNGTYITTEGYLINAIQEGAESCNCGLADANQKTGDVHMYLGLTKTAKAKNSLIIEITPAFKKKYSNYENYMTPKKKIRVTGFLLYDFIHRKDALMTCKKCSKIWRNNCWEIHPITKIQIL